MRCKESRICLWFLTSAIAVITCGCGSTVSLISDPDLQESQIATILIGSHFTKGVGVNIIGLIPLPLPRWHTTFVSDVDGQTIKGGGKIQVSAGKHLLRLNYYRDATVEWCSYLCPSEVTPHRTGLSVEFFAEGSHQYRVFAYIQDEQQWVWVTDETTSTVVAGERPPDWD